VVADVSRLGLESTEQAGRVDKDDSYKNGNPGDRDIHSGMNRKPPTEKAAGLYFFSGEECSSGFLPGKSEKNTVFCAACLVKLFNLTRESNGKYENLMEIISDLNVLIAA
jgi:hypothetical protein